MMKNRTLLAAMLLFAGTGCDSATIEPDLPANEVTVKIDAIMADHDTDGPGYAIGVFTDGTIEFAKTYGLADIATGDVIAPDTPFNLASLSKQFTGAAVANELIAENISLDDPLIEHWLGLPAFMAPITIGHLVYMASGLPEYYTLPSPVGGWASEDEFTVKDAINAVFSTDALTYEPGTEWSYSNINYQVLAELIARLNDMTFADYMNWAIFEPLEMGECWVDDQLQHQNRQSAVSYVQEGSQWREAPRRSPHYGGSGIFCSLEDLAKWNEALFAGDDFSRTMLSTRTYEHEKTNDALGLVHGKLNGDPIIWYEGGDYGVSTFMLRLTNENKTIVCLANFANAGCRDRAYAIAGEILSLGAD